MLDPTVIITDFEQAEIKAFSEVFPCASLQGCMFHLTQAWYRHFTPEMKEAYETDVAFALTMKKVFALPFVHPRDVPAAFEHIKFNAVYSRELKPSMDTFFAYVHRNYIGSEYVPALFPLVLWNVHVRVREGIARTNNSLEAWNRRFGVICEFSHIPLYRLLAYLKQEQHNTAVAIQRRISGMKPKASRFKQAMLDKRLLNLVQNYADKELSDFVHGIALNLIVSLVQFRRHREAKQGKENDMENEHDALTQEINEEVQHIQSPTQAQQFDPQRSTAPAPKRKRGRPPKQQSKRLKVSA